MCIKTRLWQALPSHSQTEIVVWCCTLKHACTSYSWTGILVPVGTSPEIVDRLNAAINEGLKSPAMNSNLGPAGRRNERGIAAGFCSLHRRRDTEMGSDRNVGGREARLSNHPAFGLWSQP